MPHAPINSVPIVLANITDLLHRDDCYKPCRNVGPDGVPSRVDCPADVLQQSGIDQARRPEVL